MTHKDIVKQIFSYIRLLGPSYRSHTDENLNELAILWLNEIKRFEVVVCEKALQKMQEIEITRYPSIAFFIKLAKQSSYELKEESVRNSITFDAYQQYIDRVSDFKHMQEEDLNFVLEKINLVEVYFPKFSEQLDSKRSATIHLARMWVKLSRDNFEIVESNFLNYLSKKQSSSDNEDKIETAKNDVPYQQAQEMQKDSDIST